MLSVRFWVTAFVLGSSAQASHTPAPLERGVLRCCFLVVNKWFVRDASPLERGLSGVLRRGARQGMKYCEIQFRETCCSEERGVICQASGGCFGFRRQCLGVTHPRPSREGSFGIQFRGACCSEEVSVRL